MTDSQCVYRAVYRGDGLGCQREWGQQSVCCHVQDCMGTASSWLYRNILIMMVVLQMTKDATLKLRRDAVTCYHRSHGDIKAAVRQFNSWHPGAVKYVRSFIQYNVRKLDQTSSYEDRKRSGRPAKVSQQQALQVAGVLKAGFLSAGLPRQWSSMQQAEQGSLLLRQIKQDAKCTTRCMRKAAMQWDDDLTFNMQRCKLQLTPEQMRKRKAYCRRMHKLGIKKLLSIVWVDAKKIYVQPPAKLRVYGSRSKPVSTITDSRVPKGGRQTKCIYYYSAVSPLVGPLEIVICTGTTGHNPGYKVSVKGAFWCQSSSMA